MADLTTLAVVKAWLGIADAQTGSDAILSGLVTSTSTDFLNAIGRQDLMPEVAYTEVRDGDGGSRMILRHWPVNSITSLTVAGVAVTASANKVAAGYYIDVDLDPERRSQIYLAGSTFTDGSPVLVVYNAGYVTAPGDVMQAVTEWVAARYKGRPGMAVSSQREAGGEHVAYDREALMPPTTAAVAERYTRAWPSLDRRADDRAYRVTRINRTITEKVS